MTFHWYTSDSQPGFRFLQTETGLFGNVGSYRYSTLRFYGQWLHLNLSMRSFKLCGLFMDSPNRVYRD